MSAWARHGLLLGLALLCGCGPDQAADDPAAAAEAEAPAPARSEVVRGPVRVVLEFDPEKPRLSDEPVLTLSVDADEGVEVDLPPFGDSIGGFLVVSFREELPRIENGRRHLAQVYRLEPETTGEHPIRPVRVTFKDLRPDGDQQEHAVETEPLTITVSSFLEGKEPDLNDLRPARGPLAIEVKHEFPLAMVLAVSGGALLLLLGLVLLLRRTRRQKPERPPTPAELARLEFERLLADDPLARGELQTFFVELTGIVRRYIERTTEVRAPEQTTEEFLREMWSHPAFDSAAKALLTAFLEAADLVKFAAHQPSWPDIEESFDRAQEFVGLEDAMKLQVGAAP
ncbi:MAG: hypothetical protein V2A76_16260 [Planctomycetota bacterium]